MSSFRERVCLCCVPVCDRTKKIYLLFVFKIVLLLVPPVLCCDFGCCLAARHSPRAIEAKLFQEFAFAGHNVSIDKQEGGREGGNDIKLVESLCTLPSLLLPYPLTICLSNSGDESSFCVCVCVFY